MKMLIGLLFLTVITTSIAQTGDRKQFGALSQDDQKYFKNDIMEGKNQIERADANVREINKLHGKIKSMEDDIEQLKKEIATLKERK